MKDKKRQEGQKKGQKKDKKKDKKKAKKKASSPSKMLSSSSLKSEKQEGEEPNKMEGRFEVPKADIMAVLRKSREANILKVRRVSKGSAAGEFVFTEGDPGGVISNWAAKPATPKKWEWKHY